MVLHPIFNGLRVVFLEFAVLERGGAKQADAVLELQHEAITLDEGPSLVQAAGIFRENRSGRRGKLNK